MSSMYNKNNFSTSSTSHYPAIEKNNINEIIKPNIDNLIRRIHSERRRERKNIISLGIASLSVVLIFFILD